MLLGGLVLGPAIAGGQNEGAPSDGEIGGTLRVFSGQVGDVWKTAFEEQYPEVTLELDSAGAQQYESILRSRIAAGNPPDVFVVWSNARTADYASRGLLQDLTDYGFIQRILPSVNREFSYNERVYAMSHGTEGEGLYINKALLEQIGRNVPRNWEELLSVAQAFQDAGIQPFAAGFKDDWTIMRYTNSAFATLGYGRDPDYEEKLIAGEVTFDHPGWYETFDKLRVLIERGYMGEFPLATDNSQAVAAFGSGSAGMMIHGSWEAEGLAEMGSAVDVIFTATPVNEPGEELYACWKAGVGSAISADTNNLATAVAFLGTVAQPDIVTAHAMEMKTYPGFEDVTVDGINPILDRFVAEFVAAGMTQPGAHYKWPAGMSNNWKKKLQEFVGGQISTDDMVRWLNQEYASMDNIYADNN